MEKLSMCRICLSPDTGLHSIFGTHLQEMYEFLTSMLLVTGDSRPSLACDLCCSRLETCHELRSQSLRSEELFTQLLRHKVQVNLQVMPNMHPSMEDVIQTTADVLDNDDVKQEDAEDDARDDSGASSEDDTAICDVLKTEPVVDAWGPNDAAVEQDDAAVEQDDADPYHSALGLHTECDIPLDIVKEEPDDVDTGAPRLASQNHRNDKLLNSLKRTDQTMNKVEERRNRETRRAVEDTPVKKNKIVETDDEIDIRLYHDKRNNSEITSDHSEAHKEIFENEISSEQSVYSSSSDKLTPLLCDTCQKCFTRKASLIRHIRAHTGKIPYQCDVFKKCFSIKRYVYAHMRTHTGEKLYHCDVCKKCFIEKSYLNTHMRVHTGERPYECNVCKKCFKTTSHLNKHMHTHSGERPYECNVCKKCFKTTSHLNRHMHTHTDEKPYECNLCKKCFTKKSSLDYHYAYTHG